MKSLFLLGFMACKTPAPPPSSPPPLIVAEPNPLLDVQQVSRRAPEQFSVAFHTTKGDFTVEVTRAWSPAGADRFYSLVSAGFYDNSFFFRTIEHFVTQFGISPDPSISAAWSEAALQDEPVVGSNTTGTVSFAATGKNSRSTQLFINLKDNPELDEFGFSPIGQVVTGMDVVKSLYAGYGEGLPRGRGPYQEIMRARGDEYVRTQFPKLDEILEAKITEP